MNLTDLLTPDRVISGLRVQSKAQLLAELSRRAGKALGIDGDGVREALERREALGSTGVGQGIAIPHARVDGVRRISGLFARLERAIDFAAIDARPVDLVFLLLIPPDAGNEHLAALACVSRRLRDPGAVHELRTTKEQSRLYAALVS